MLTKLFAGALLALILLPFTEPFSTCDLASLLGHANSDAGTPFAASVMHVDATLDANASLVVLVATRERIKLVALYGTCHERIAVARVSAHHAPPAAATSIQYHPPESAILRV